MTLRLRVPFGVAYATLLAAGLAGLALTPRPAPAEERATTREQQIAELEQQIAELSRQLQALKNGAAASPAAAPGTLPQDWVKALNWRCIGPASMGGRIVALSVFEADPATYWVATASGGLLKTTNNGVTFEHQFDREATVSVGDVCVAPSDRNVVYVGTGENNPRNSVSWGDGVYKSTDGGKTWKNVGLKKTFQVGRIAVHPTNPNVVYVGALGRLYGPNAERGLFKSTDGGQTWERVLFVNDQTGVIDVQLNPANPDEVIAATWERQRDGFDSHPGNDLPIAEGYDGYDPIKKWGPGSGIHKSTDGGKTWTKLTKGLPSSNLGRVDVEYYRKNPKILYALIDCEKIGMGIPPVQTYLGVSGEVAAGKFRLTEVTANSPAAQGGLRPKDVVESFGGKPVPNFDELGKLIDAQKPDDKVTVKVLRGTEAKELTVTLGSRPVSQQGTPGTTSPKRPWGAFYGGQRENVQDKQGPNSHEYGGLYRSEDGGETWQRINSVNPRPMYFTQIRVDPSDNQYLYVLGVSLYRSRDGGKTFTADGDRGVHPDQHALWINPRDGRHMIVGCDGGFYATYDRMEHWDHLNHMAIAQFYHVALDTRRPYKVYGGLQDNGTWGGPSQVFHGSGPINEDWFVVSGGDGFVCRVDPNDPDLVYYESQDGMMGRYNLRTGERGFIRPRRPGQDRPGADLALAALPGLFNLPSVLPLNLAPPRQLPRSLGDSGYRFNWNTPFILSNHNSKIFYCAGNFVFRSLDRGNDLRVISPEITRTKKGSGTALAESPRNPDVLWAGTDDGNLWVSRDGGARWVNVADKVGLPGPRWVSTVEPSRFAEGRCYVAFDGHRSDDDEPHVYVTEDFGATWKSLRANLPSGSTRVVREDLQNQNLLYLGNEFSAYASVDRGASWTRINNNLPTVAVHEFAQHPTTGELVAATHGRSIWVLDVSALRQVTAARVKAKAYLYEPNSAIRWRSEPTKISMYGSGSRRYFGENPPRGAQLYYHLAQKAEKISLKVLDYSGKTVRDIPVQNEPGLRRVSWDLLRTPDQSAVGAIVGGIRGMTRGGPGGRGMEPAAPGMYRVVLTVDGQEYAQGLKVEADPAAPPTTFTPEETDEQAKEKSPPSTDR